MRVLQIFKLLAIMLIGVYLGVVGWIYTIQDQLVYGPSHHVLNTPREAGLGYEAVSIRTGDGVQLSGWFIAGGATQKTVLFFHGNGGSIDCCIEHARLYHQLGFAMLLIDYRGYGASTGEPSEPGLYQDAEAAWQHLTMARGIPAAQIVVVGQSLGGGVATWLATQHPPAGLILDSTFTALTDVGARQYPWLPVSLLARNRYPSITRIASIAAPLLILHSRDDTLIPFSHAEQLYNVASLRNKASRVVPSTA